MLYGNAFMVIIIVLIDVDVNCCYEGYDISAEIKDSYAYIRSGQANNPLTKRIDEAVVKGRKNEMWRSEYIKERQILMEEREEGREEGREEERANTERERSRAEAAERRVAELERLLAAK